MSVLNGICTSEVFQIEVSDGLVHRLGSCMCLQIIMTAPIRVHNGIFIGEELGRFSCMGVAKMYTCIQLGYVCQASF